MNFSFRNELDIILKILIKERQLKKIVLALSFALLANAATPSMGGMEIEVIPEGGTITPPSFTEGDKTIGVKWKSFKSLVTDLQKGSIEKPILLFVAQSTCTYCSQELRNITADQKLSDFINANYYGVYAEQDKEELPKNLFASLVPAFFVLDPSTGAPMTPEPATGYLPTKDLLGYLQQVKQAYDYYLEQKNKPVVKPNVIK